MTCRPLATLMLAAMVCAAVPAAGQTSDGFTTPKEREPLPVEAGALALLGSGLAGLALNQFLRRRS